MSSYCSGDGLIFAIIQWYVVYEVFMINECHTNLDEPTILISTLALDLHKTDESNNPPLSSDS